MVFAASTGVQSADVEGASVAWTSGVLSLVGGGVTICVHLLDAWASASSVGAAALSVTI